MDLLSERGIFLVNKLRSILMKFIYNSIVDILEENLTNSNIGARKTFAPKDHLLVVNSVIEEARKTSQCLDFIYYDVRQAFDSLWPTHSYLDLFSNGIKDRRTKMSDIARTIM